MSNKGNMEHLIAEKSGGANSAFDIGPIDLG